MTDKIQETSPNPPSHSDRIVQLVQLLNYHNNTFARIPLTNLTDVGKTAVMLLSSILGYKSVAIFFENEKNRLELLAGKGGVFNDDDLLNHRNSFVDQMWHHLQGPQTDLLESSDPVFASAATARGMKRIILSVPIIGVSEPGEKRVGMILISDPPDDFEADADMTVLEIITGLISGAIANCLSLQAVKRKNRQVIEREKALKNTLQRLESAHQRMLTILDSIGAVVYIIDINSYKVLYCNKFCKELYGDVTDSICWQVLHKEMTGPCDFCPNSKLVHDETLLNKTYTWEHFNTMKQRWYSMHDRLLNWVDGSLVKIQISIDITQRKEQEIELKNLRNYLSNIIDSMPSMLVGVDAGGRVTQWNKSAERTTGVNAEIAHGKVFSDVFPPMASHMEAIQLSIRNREVKQEEKRRRISGSQTYYEDITIYPLISNGEDGAVIRVDDVTDKVLMEEIMIQSEKMLSVGGLAAGMAHEINNPLAGMIQNTAVMANRLGGKMDIPANSSAALKAGTTMEAIRTFMELREIPRFLNAITESGMRAAAIVENMLSFTRKTDYQKSPHIISILLDKALELASIDYNIKKHFDFKQIEIVKEYSDDVPPVPCDGATIMQVLLNILRNGAQAMQDAKTEKPMFIIRTRLEKDRNQARIEIEDNGPGMDKETCKRVFEPFFTTKSVGAGTGLGLSVSYFIITDNHGGEISVDSDPGSGTNFIIRLPLTDNRC